MIFNNNQITGIYYSGFTIVKAFSCDGELVFGEFGKKMEYQYSNGTTGTVECNGDPILTSGDTNHQVIRTPDTPCYRTVVVGDCVTGIGDSAFEQETCLISCILPQSLVTIGKSAFAHSCLPSINIPSGVTRIEGSAFAGCTSLTAITIPIGVKKITSGVFMNCTRLTSIEIPSGVTSIGISSFDGCSGLISIKINAVTPPEIFASSFRPFDNTNNCPILVPTASVNAYKTAPNWTLYASRIQGF